MYLKTRILMTAYGISRILHDTGVIKRGQKDNYAILQISHRLEKGMCIRNPRKGWGYEKASVLVELIHREMLKKTPDEEAVDVGKAVLAAFIEHKELQKDSAEKLNSIKRSVDSYELLASIDSSFGGVLHASREMVLVDSQAVEPLFMTRHSVRDFDDSEVDSSKITRAVEYALKAPSACNRQATNVYVISEEERREAGGGNDYHAKKFIILTGVMDAYVPSELEDWIVSTSIFAGYLSLALHSQGIGSCIIRKPIIHEGAFEKGIRKVCSIPKNESIVLELAIGNYKESFDVPVSHRRSANDIIKHI